VAHDPKEPTGGGFAPVPAHAWYGLALLTLIYACHWLDRTVISLIIEPVRQEFGLTDAQIGLLTGLAYGTSFALAGLPFGYLIDRVNRRRLLAVVAAFWSTMTAVAGLAQNFTTLLATRALLGAAEAGGTPAAMAMISDMFPPRLRSTAVGILYVGTGIGAAASALIAALIAAPYGWRVVLVAAGVPGIILGLLVWFTMGDVPRVSADPGGKVMAAPPVGTALRFLAGQRGVMHLFVVLPMVSGGMAAVGVWLPAFLMRSHGMSLPNAGFVLAIAFGLFASLGTLVGGAVSDRLGRYRSELRLWFCAAMILLAIPATFGVLFLDSIPAAVALTFVVAFCGFTVFPVGFSAAMDMMPSQMRGITTATSQVVTNLVGYGLGPYAVGLFSDYVGGPDSLRQAIAAVVAFTLAIASWQMVLAARHYGAGLERMRRFANQPGA
jgi:predicted MFS family arabinose efflux permease